MEICISYSIHLGLLVLVLRCYLVLYTHIYLVIIFVEIEQLELNEAFMILYQENKTEELKNRKNGRINVNR